MAQMGQLTEHAGLLARTVTARATEGTQPAWLRLLTGQVEQTATVLREGSGTAPGQLAALPVAPHRSPVPARAGEPDHLALHRLAEGAERLQSAVFQAARRYPAAQPLHGAALRQTAEALALAHLLTGNLVRAVGADLTGPQQTLLDRAATELREAARSWAEAGARWAKVVDLGSPGQGPRSRHPFVVDAEAMAMRAGRLLFGQDWNPQTKGAAPRSSEQILAAVGGVEELLQSVRQLPAAAAVAAAQHPELIERLAPQLVTDDGRVDPRLHGGPRWFPAQPQQLAALADAYAGAAHTSAGADVALTALATLLGVPAVRAELDLAARVELLQQRGAAAAPGAVSADPLQQIRASLQIHAGSGPGAGEHGAGGAARPRREDRAPRREAPGIEP
jgi:hypothetical protein